MNKSSSRCSFQINVFHFSHMNFKYFNVYYEGRLIYKSVMARFSLTFVIMVHLLSYF